MSPSRLRLRAGELLLANATASRRIIPIFANQGFLVQSACPFTTSRSRQKGVISKQALEHASPRISSQQAPKSEMAQRMRGNINEVGSEALSVLIPGTFVLPPLSGFPKSLIQKLRFLGYWCLVKGQEIITNAAVKFTSKPSIFTRAAFKAKRSALIPTAKALHRTMAEALASGDRDTINRICTRKFAGTLVASIDGRPRGRRYGWELVGYTNKLFYPSVKSHRITPISREKYAPIIRQAVVAISSRQRRVEYDARGQVVPGSEKEIEAVENVVVVCLVDPKTWTQSEWRLLGTVKPTTLEEWKQEAVLLKTMMLQNR
ncbi:hypothetical protein C8A03DRAFT_40611 [Achaetomium macrosporum]|uniref:Large ribosomal subunit protein mL45 n=1 Tax=Achaetomium macrosporum TaxID=79813 RepID=A0AAN7HHB2_9PEZI|nr:hypothetical protein C8A03DRAFT_40611 [Achaetomium macrosporum]